MAPLPPGVVWGDRLPDRDIALPGASSSSGVWSDGTDVWVVTDTAAGKISVYSLADGAEHTDRGFTLPGGAEYAAGLWSDGATLWVADVNSGSVRAYRLSDGARQADRDLDTAGNGEPAGIWSDGTTMWVADFTDSRVYAYDLTTKARVADKELDLDKNPGETYTPSASGPTPTRCWPPLGSAARSSPTASPTGSANQPKTSPPTPAEPTSPTASGPTATSSGSSTPPPQPSTPTPSPASAHHPTTRRARARLMRRTRSSKTHHAIDEPRPRPGWVPLRCAGRSYGDADGAGDDRNVCVGRGDQQRLERRARCERAGQPARPGALHLRGVPLARRGVLAPWRPATSSRSDAGRSRVRAGPG